MMLSTFKKINILRHFVRSALFCATTQQIVKICTLFLKVIEYKSNIDLSF